MANIMRKSNTCDQFIQILIRKEKRIDTKEKKLHCVGFATSELYGNFIAFFII